MRTKKIYIENDIATIVCDSCGKFKNARVGLNIASIPVLFVTCSCGNHFKVIIDRRRHYRKKVKLTGHFKTRNSNIEYPMIVEDVSLSGIKMKTPFTDRIKVGDTIVVTFRLNDANQNIIDRVAVVKRIENDSIGVEFAKDKLYDKNLWFYLMN